MKRTKKNHCEDCNDTGFLLVKDNNGTYIEKCDVCSAFKSDAEANKEAFRLAILGWELENV